MRFLRANLGVDHSAMPAPEHWDGQRGAMERDTAMPEERMAELQDYGCSYDESLEVVSQEMGHFRAEITKTYLR